MNRLAVVAVVLVGVAAGCAHDAEGHRVRTSRVRFDAQSVTGATGAGTITRNIDGSWGSERLALVDNQLRGSFSGAYGDYGFVQFDRLPNGIRYTPSSYSRRIWTFVTEDGRPIPADLEIPLYLAAERGIGGQWVNIWTPAEDDQGPQLEADCGVVLFEMQGRQVAGWVARQSAECPAPTYPGRETLARLIYSRNEVWESPLRPLP